MNGHLGVEPFMQWNQQPNDLPIMLSNLWLHVKYKINIPYILIALL